MPSTYTVQGGDTLFGIARKLGVTVDAIVAANNIANPSLIKPGQVLTIPDAAGAPAPGTSQPTAPPPAAPAASPPAAPTPSLPPTLMGPFPHFNLHDPCAQDPGNLITNGSMGPANHDTPYGTVVDGWDPFVFSGDPPNYRWEDNEMIDPGGAQQLYSSNPFDAGVMQTVHHLKPGVSYMLRWGYSLAAKSYDGPNVRVQTIGRKLGVDATGGRDPHAQTVLWGPDIFDGKPALNLPQMQMIFVAVSPDATVFLRAMATDGSSGENRCWIDAICMEARPEIPVVPVTAPAPSTPAKPTTPPPAAPPASSAGAATSYTVQSGDTLYAIARKFGVTVDAIVAVNKISDPNRIKPGQVLNIPVKS